MLVSLELTFISCLITCISGRPQGTFPFINQPLFDFNMFNNQNAALQQQIQGFLTQNNNILNNQFQNLGLINPNFLNGNIFGNTQAVGTMPTILGTIGTTPAVEATQAIETTPVPAVESTQAIRTTQAVKTTAAIQVVETTEATQPLETTFPIILLRPDDIRK